MLLGVTYMQWVGGGGGAGEGVVQMEGDSDRDLIIFEKIIMNSKSAHVIQLRNEDYDLNTIDLS